MNRKIKDFWNSYFAPPLDFRVRLFNVLAMAGTLVSVFMGIIAIINDAGLVNVIINLATAVLSFALLTYSKRTGKYQLCYMITIFAIFVVLFPILFFSAGAYHSGMPCFFVFAVCFTIFMLEGKSAIVLSLVEIATYIACCLVAFYYPQTINWYDTDFAVMFDVIIAFVTVCVALGITLFMHFRLYNRQQKQLSEQNDILERAGKQKLALLADVSHEIRTPLAVMSGYAQRARKQIADGTVSEETLQGLLTIQLEAHRLAELAQQLIYTPLAKDDTTLPQAVHISEIAKQMSALMHPILSKNNNSLVMKHAKDCPPVFVNASMIVQVLINLCINANRHTNNGVISITSNPASDGMVEVCVSDNGDGISPELLPTAFERGTSGDGKSGLGLSICKEVVEGHGGEISIQPLAEGGTSVTFTLPIESNGGSI